MLPSLNFRAKRRSRIRSNPKLVDVFNHWFTTISATTPTLLEQAYQLRYQVYCKENNFENPDEHPWGYEMDEFDSRSVHTLLLDRPSGSVAGTVRLILPHHVAFEKSYPIQRVCNYHLLSDRNHFLVTRSAEISRFAVSKEFRRKAQELSPSDRHNKVLIDRRTIMPFITLGLMKGIMRMSVENGITDLFAVMEPALLRLLSHFGIYFRPIGPLVDYHGVRQPCHADIESLLARVYKERTDVWEIITDEGRLLYGMRKTYLLCG
jgi:N-acyl amino acid synthase of PEP-CTERM/exosortase system